MEKMGNLLEKLDELTEWVQDLDQENSALLESIETVNKVNKQLNTENMTLLDLLKKKDQELQEWQQAYKELEALINNQK
ncbi:hypothetical protein [Ligilactobacillus saerimneri]|uniref:hypothetical protein n=1 Tax=Ligilactobacillus saerimneri TaxID=228229 RepID=UPI001DD1E935|nr:hypothetical protein [Ligilactobacillus saerimneri]HJF29931.1 hypothetical protein [Ligilactobacillus saerimneri]